MIRDNKETAFDMDLLTIMDNRSLIENYTLWERLLEIMIINDRIDNYEKLVNKIFNAILKCNISENKIKTNNKYEHHTALFNTLHAAICRTAALRWGKNFDKRIENVFEMLNDKINMMDIKLDVNILNDFKYKNLYMARKKYCSTRMVNKYIIPIPIDCIINSSVINSKAEPDKCLYPNFPSKL